jgi:hypothetical protein
MRMIGCARSEYVLCAFLFMSCSSMGSALGLNLFLCRLLFIDLVGLLVTIRYGCGKYLN